MNLIIMKMFENGRAFLEGERSRVDFEQLQMEHEEIIFGQLSNEQLPLPLSFTMSLSGQQTIRC
jgi:hypothetical protein